MNNSVIFFILSVNNSIFKKWNKVYVCFFFFYCLKKGLVGVKYDYVGCVYKKGFIVF